MIRHPTDDDILCGKEKSCIQAPGSIRFRNIINSYAKKYDQAQSKFEKMSLTRQIFDLVSQTSRFLKFNEDEQGWEEISAQAARDKIGHSLRFAGRSSARRKKKTHKRSGSISSTSSSGTESSTQGYTLSPGQQLESCSSFDSDLPTMVGIDNDTMEELIFLFREDQVLSVADSRYDTTDEEIRRSSKHRKRGCVAKPVMALEGAGG